MEVVQATKAPLTSGRVPIRWKDFELDQTGYYWTGSAYYDHTFAVSLALEIELIFHKNQVELSP